MKRLLFVTVCLLLGLQGGLFVSAAGGGGGGGGGSSASNCTSDTWSCDSWSTCTIDGTQTRDCTLTTDCAFASTASPDTQQSCTPECTEDEWTCSDWDSCNSAGRQERTCELTDNCLLTDDASPITEQTCEPSCTADTFTCSDWSTCSLAEQQSRDCEISFDCPLAETRAPSESQSCSPSCTEDTWSCSNWSACTIYGVESRTCTLTQDCSLTDDTKPIEAQACSSLQCGNKSTTRERVLCRLNLAPAGLARELEIEYLPEVCRVLEGEEQEECIEYYEDFQPCWDAETWSERFVCAKQVMEVTDDIPAMRAACEALGGEPAEECLEELREHVYWVILFRMYDLEERAEDMAIEKGIDLELVADLDTAVIEAKVAFLEASSYEERRAIILALREAWAVFNQQIEE